MSTANKPLVGVVMGSSSDWDVMQHAVAILKEFGVEHEARVLSAHRMPDQMFDYAKAARERGLRAIIAGAGGAAHLPGMIASQTIVPVLGVPVPSKYLRGEDSLLSIVQMPKGIPVATFAIGEAGAANAALAAVAMLAADDASLAEKLLHFRAQQTEAAMAINLAGCDGRWSAGSYVCACGTGDGLQSRRAGTCERLPRRSCSRSFAVRQLYRCRSTRRAG